MRILVAAPADPYSLTNFVEQFRDFGHDVTHWDFTTQREFPIPESERYDLLFHVLVNDEISGDALAEIKQRGIVRKSLLFACDDDWRLPVSLAHVGAYDYATTNDPNAIPIYRAKGHSHVRHVQYGVNPKAWTVDWPYVAPDQLYPNYDVVFIGQNYTGRQEFLDAIGQRCEGKPNAFGVWVYGQGFSGGPLSQEKMLTTLRRAKIVLGLNWSAGGALAGRQSQIKGRLFENAALGVFQLVSADPRLGRYFADDEIATFVDLDDCVTKIRHYLDHPEERRAIAKAGQERVLRDHTWKSRWKWLWQVLEEEP